MFACVDPTFRFVEPSVARTRFAAALNPYPFEERGKAALLLAGGENIREHQR